ncbi:hypothetical protein NC651_010481 [Populus alba x Populus x berolinensis]|nr:hypothetical protein NC651_010481 [Populus alba x Populus x berolinensis]
MEAVVVVLHKKEEKNQRYTSKSKGSYKLHSLNILDLLFLRHPNMCYNPTITFMRVRKKSTVDPPLQSIREGLRNNRLRSSQVVGDVQNWQGSLHFAQVILLSAKGE